MSVTAFTSREGGFSSPPFDSLNLGSHVGDDPIDVERNRALIESLYGPTVYMNQSHSADVVEVEFPTIVDGDALITRVPHLTLAVQVADCIPLLLEGESAVAAVHVGRRGLVNGITDKVLAEMAGEELIAHIGPSICSSCYEVGADIYHEVIERYPLAASTTSSGGLALDLAGALAAHLTLHGVAVIRDPRCTVEDRSLFSYRRDGQTGRQVGLISL